MFKKIFFLVLFVSILFVQKGYAALSQKQKDVFRNQIKQGIETQVDQRSNKKEKENYIESTLEKAREAQSNSVIAQGPESYRIIFGFLINILENQKENVLEESKIEKEILEDEFNKDKKMTELDESFLISAIKDQNIKRIEKYIKENKLKNFEINEKGKTILHLSVEVGNLDIVRIILKEGIDLNVANKNGVTPLILALDQNKFNIADEIIDYGGNPMKVDNYGMNSLMWAAYKGAISIVERILEKGNININKKDNEGWTALMIAVSENNKDIVKKLINKNSDLSLRNNNGLTALDIAYNLDNKEILSFLMKKNEKEINIGESFILGGMEYKILGVEEYNYLGQDAYPQRPKNGIFIVFKYEYKNIDTKHGYPGEFALKVGEHMYSESSTVSVYATYQLGDTYDTSEGTLLKGAKRKKIVGFDVNKNIDLKDGKLYLAPWGDSVTDYSRIVIPMKNLLK